MMFAPCCYHAVYSVFHCDEKQFSVSWKFIFNQMKNSFQTAEKAGFKRMVSAWMIILQVPS